MSEPGRQAAQAGARGGRTMRTVLIAAAFAVALAVIVTGYRGGPAKHEAPTAPPASPAVGVASAEVGAAPSAPAAAVATLPASSAVAAPAAAPSGLPAEAMAPADAAAVRGVIKPRDEVLFSANLAARIAQMPYKEGERFRKGALLVAFDCTRMRSAANAAWAAHRASRQVLDQSVELDKYNAIGKADVEIAKAKAEQSGAEAGALEAQIRDCSITAPFSGIVLENIARQHENAAVGKELMRVLNDSELEIHLIAPSAWLRWLQPGRPFRFRIDETARSYEAQVARLGAAVDPVSQTVRVVGVFTGSREAVQPGMSGSAAFAPPPNARATADAAPAAKAPPPP